jgi:hypothetical protein
MLMNLGQRDEPCGVGGADDREQADTGRWAMSNYSDVWLKDNLDETKLAILEAEYALEILPYTVQDRPLYAFIGWLFVRPIVFILKRQVERVEKWIERERGGSAIVPVSIEKGRYIS